MPHPVTSSAEIVQRLRGTPLVVMLDVDGTLAPIAARPEDAVVPNETRRTLARLAARPATQVVFVSGRAAADARRMVPLSATWVLGNHGIEILTPDGDLTVDGAVEAHGPAVARAAQAITDQVATMPGVLVENKHWTLTVHHRLANELMVPRLRRLVETVAEAEGLRTSSAKKAIEVRPPVDVDKGTAVIALAHRLGALVRGAALMFAGDDATDEDAFRALRARSSAAVTVRVIGGGTPGEKVDVATQAEFRVPDTESLRILLDAIAGMPG